MANVTWYETNLKTRYVSNNSSSTNITGIAGDPISDGLNLAIQGGTGANNQTDPDVLRSLAGAGNVWTYGAGNLVAATKVRNQGNRAVNLGFGFEAIANAGDRQTVMQRMIEWLGASPVGIAEPEAAAMPAAIEIEPARPNPFNPATILAFRMQLGGRGRAPDHRCPGPCGAGPGCGRADRGPARSLLGWTRCGGAGGRLGRLRRGGGGGRGRRRSHEADARPLIAKPISGTHLYRRMMSS